MKRYRVMGVNSDSDVCSICGKSELKKVVWLAELDADGNPSNTFAAGTTCAAKLLGYVKTKFDSAKELVEYAARQEQDRIALKHAVRKAWLDAKDNNYDVFVYKQGKHYSYEECERLNRRSRNFIGAYNLVMRVKPTDARTIWLNI